MGIEEYTAPFTHAQLKKLVQTYLDVSRKNARLAQRDRDYYDGEQISEAKKAELAARGQPEVYTNKIFSGIGGLLGIFDASVSDPEAMPRTVASQGAADIATKTLRYLADRAKYKRVREGSSKNFLVEGTGAAIVPWNGQYPDVTYVPWEDLVYDPYSRDLDFADAKWIGMAKLVDAEDVAVMFPNAEPQSAGAETVEDFFDDRSKKREWWTGSKNQVRLVDIYYEVRGEWHHAIFTTSSMLHASPSEYRDDMNLSMHPYVASSYEIKRNGDRYGAIRHMIPLQDQVNSRQSRLLHLTNHRQVRATDMMAAQVDVNTVRREATRADGVIPFGYDTISTADRAQGEMLLLQQNERDLDRLSPTPAVLGRLSGTSESGRARQILQQAGYTELARAFGRLEAFEHAIYKKLWCVAKQYFDQPTWIRVGADPRTPEFLQVNEPVMGVVMRPVTDPATGEPHIDPMTGQPAMMQAIGVVGMKNRLAELDLDIVLTTVPDTVTLEQEVFEKLMETAQSTGVSPFDPRFLAFLEMAPLPNKRETIERIKRLAAEAQQQDDGTQAAMAQGAAQADMQLKQAKAAKDAALGSKAQAETAIIAAGLHNHAMGHPMGPLG